MGKLEKIKIDPMMVIVPINLSPNEKGSIDIAPQW